MYLKQNKIVRFVDLGNISYEHAFDLQTTLFNKIVEKKLVQRDLNDSEINARPENLLLFCTHPHVFTLGRSGTADHLLVTQEKLKQIDAEFVEINRGGDITYHGPGQLVVYPIFDLDNFFTDIHKYLRILEEAVILTLADYGIKAGRVEGLTGVWIDGDVIEKSRKIAAMGVKASRWVTMHGLALNINPDLTYFNHIVPCGITDRKVTSMAQELKTPPPFEEVSEKLKKHLVHLFACELKQFSSEQLPQWNP